MSLLPFSPVGVQDKLAQLYTLSNPELAVQANEISSNFKSWIRSRFALNSSQSNYLNQISADVLWYYGQQCALCFINRLPIILIYPDPPTAPGYTKWTALTDSIRVGTDGAGNSEITGGVIFTISYK